MKAISTRYIGQTDRRPARIIAADQDGNRIVVPVHNEADTFPYTDRHRDAAVALCHKMAWEGAETLIGGSVRHGMVWVFPPEQAARALSTSHFLDTALEAEDDERRLPDVKHVLEPERRARCPRCGSTEGQVVLPGSGDSTCLACGADWPVTP